MKQIKLIHEGKAVISPFIDKSTYLKKIFYNPVQIFNRDLSLLVTQLYAKKMKEEQGESFKGISFLDALSATGLDNQFKGN